MVAPRPGSSGKVPQPVAEDPHAAFATSQGRSEPVELEDLHDEDVSVEVASAEAANAEEASSAPANAVVGSAETAAVSEGPAASGDAELPNVPLRNKGPKAFAAVVASAAALVVASVVWNEFASSGKAPAAGARLVPERLAPKPAAPPANQEPVAPPVAPMTSEVVGTPPPALERVVETSPEKALTTVAVTIKTVPEDAVIFRARQRLGTGVVEVNVERNAKQRFTALLDGYTPANFTLDGSRDSVTIRLKRPPKREAAPAPESDAPAGDVTNGASNAAAAPAPSAAPTATVAPTPESPAPAAPSPVVSSPASPPE